MGLLYKTCLFALKNQKHFLNKNTFCKMCRQPIKCYHRNKISFRKYSIYTSQETIFSLSSGHGKCGVAVIRVSGSKAAETLSVLGRFKSLPKPRYAKLRTLYDHTCDIPIDHGLVIWFPGESTKQRSFIEPTRNIPVGLCNYQNKNVVSTFHVLI